MRIKWYNWLWLPVAVILLRLLLHNVLKGTDDFDVFMFAAKKLANGQNIYLPPYFNDLRYLYLPFFAWVLSFMNGLEMTSAKFIFLLLNLGLLFRLVWILKEYAKSVNLNLYRNFVWVIPVSLLLVYFVNMNFSVMQLTILILWCILESNWQLRKGREVAAGAILALGAVIKVMPLVFILFYLYKKHTKLFVSSIVAMIVLLLVPSISLGFNGNLLLINDWFLIIDPSYDNHFSANETFNIADWQGLTSIAAFWFNDTGAGIGLLFLNVMRLVVLAFAMLIVGFKPFVSEKSNAESFRNLSVISLCIPIIFPHMRNYDYLLIVPAVLWISLKLLNNAHIKRKGFWFTVLCFYCLIFVAGRDLVGTKLFHFLLDFRIYSYLAIGFLVWMFVLERAKGRSGKKEDI